LKRAGEILGIEVLDHVIIGSGGFSRVVTLEEEIKAKELQIQHEKSKKMKTPRGSRRGKKKAA
jgi:hypothetical protein